MQEYKIGEPVRLVKPLEAIDWIRAHLATKYGESVGQWPPEVLDFLQSQTDEIMRAWAGPPALVGDVGENTISTERFVTTTTHKPTWWNMGCTPVVGHLPCTVYRYVR